MVEIVRLRMADGTPVMLETNRFPSSYSFLMEEELSGSLYALLLDRKQLSKKNGLQNRIGDPFVYMTIAETCVKLNCGHEKACRLFKELEFHGLVFREGQGFGKAVKIYPVDLF